MKALLEKIRLRKLKPSDLELVRSWRNDPSVQKYLLYKEHISEEAQKQWFSRIDPHKSVHYIIEAEQRPIGLIYLDRIDESAAITSVFIGERDMRGSPYAALACLIMSLYSFKRLNLKRLISVISTSNNEALKMDQILGFDREISRNGDFLTRESTLETFLKSADRVLKRLNLDYILGDIMID